ncbi:DUF58 domain-containing protein [Caminibacter mediatlanticus]|uniref:DUF58 domain-containing protein n=1 Tax=Caminibacter mediatlanticus TB-2 TaxID=391592 RepID=A0AAI9F2Z0_9BACT|nr:DUF58 domain-containing protein [Caminibacter mediatlanticus]EDM24303.1 hypothetical protein CMTB2_02268 [Caminibacter mediatlanticus TB-2]
MKLLEQFFDIRIKKSKYFYLLLVYIFFLFSAAYVHNNNIAYIVLFFTISFLFINLFLGRKNIKNIKLIPLSYERAFANTPFKYKFLLQGEGFDIHIHNKVIPILEKKEVIDLEYKFKKRGEFEIKDEIIYSFYPLRIIKFLKKVPINKKIIVYPQIKGKSLDDTFFKSKDLLGQRDDFEGLKSYEIGDSLSLIHWGSFAKGEMASKKFSFLNESKNLIFDIDNIDGDLEFKLSQLTKWVIEAYKKGYNFKVKLKNIYLDSKVGIDEILKKLALY